MLYIWLQFKKKPKYINYVVGIFHNPRRHWQKRNIFSIFSWYFDSLDSISTFWNTLWTLAIYIYSHPLICKVVNKTFIDQELFITIPSLIWSLLFFTSWKTTHDHWRIMSFINDEPIENLLQINYITNKEIPDRYNIWTY